ncbi:MAG: hypothetical protein ABIL16_04115 [candidate division WOR-3 bacterium]
MPISDDFLKGFMRTLETGTKDDLAELGLKIAHFGWFKRLKMVINVYEKRFGGDELSDLMSVVYYTISKMDSKRAYKHTNGKGEFYYRCKRIFYEYLGYNPLALKYDRLARKQYPQQSTFWRDVREKYFILYKGDFDKFVGLEPSEDDIEYISQLAIKTYAEGIYNLLLGRGDESYLKKALRVLNLTLSENYDHDSLRIMQVLIPYTVFMGKGQIAKRLIKSAIDTAKTERSLYMFKWFEIYKAILSRDENYLKFWADKFYNRRFLYHEVMCKGALLLMGYKEYGERVEIIKNKHWHKHTLKFVEVLYGNG